MLDPKKQIWDTITNALKGVDQADINIRKKKKTSC